ncbi:MAG TPA: hypothetical protein VGD21_09490 [Lysobacter sp.]
MTTTELSIAESPAGTAHINAVPTEVTPVVPMDAGGAAEGASDRVDDVETELIAMEASADSLRKEGLISTTDLEKKKARSSGLASCSASCPPRTGRQSCAAGANSGARF